MNFKKCLPSQPITVFVVTYFLFHIDYAGSIIDGGVGEVLGHNNN